MKTTELHNENFDRTITENDQPVLVDFWAPWCGPCQALSPVLEEVAERQQGKAIIAKVNVDEAPELAARYGIRSIPTMIVFKGGSPVNTLQGVKDQEAIEESLKAA